MKDSTDQVTQFFTIVLMISMYFLFKWTLSIESYLGNVIVEVEELQIELSNMQDQINEIIDLSDE